MKKLLSFIVLGAAFLLTGCPNDSDVVSHNLSKDSDNFKIERRIVFYNGITNDYMLQIEGKCTRDNTSTDRVLGIVCQTGPNEYKKHMLGLSDNVTFFIEQVDSAKASPYHYKVIFKPTVVIPDLEVR
ncbi:hypothetical protein SJ_180 [Proteus phage SJ_PmiM]|nr:hypothetical protein SJ_180 [Proteus phage SJ_PmiM]